MKQSFILIILCLFSFVACTGFETDTISGQFKTSEGHITFKSKNGLSEIFEGQVNLKFNAGLLGFYDPSITIIQDGSELGEIKIPRSGFQNKVVHISSAEMDQNFSLEAILTNSVIEKWTDRKESVSCDYYGYCYGCKISTDANGEIKNECGYDNRHDCDGKRWEVRENTKFAQQLNIKFLENGTQQEIASFTGKASKIRQEYKVVEYGTCE